MINLGYIGPRPDLAELNRKRVWSKETREKVAKAHIGKPSWNSGLTKENTPRLAEIGKAISEARIKNRGKRIKIPRNIFKMFDEPHLCKCGCGNLVIKAKTNYMKGHKSPEGKERERVRMLGNKLRVGLPSPSKGRIVSQETRLKISITHKGRVQSNAEKEKRVNSLTKYWKKVGFQSMPEKRLQEALKSKGILFETHANLPGTPDIFIEGDPPVCIFVDGIYWHSIENRPVYDKEVTNCLKEQGYKVLRFTDIQVNKEIDRVISKIESEVYTYG